MAHPALHAWTIGVAFVAGGLLGVNFGRPPHVDARSVGYEVSRAEPPLITVVLPSPTLTLVSPTRATIHYYDYYDYGTSFEREESPPAVFNPPAVPESPPALEFHDLYVVGSKSIQLCTDGYKVILPEGVMWSSGSGNPDHIQCDPAPREIDHYGR